MNSMAFIGNLILIFSLLSPFCECGNITITEESISVTTTSIASSTDTSTTLMVPTNTRKKVLILCQCDIGEVVNHTGQCQLLVDGTKVPMEQPPWATQQGPQLISTTDFNITIKELECPYHQIDLQDGQFIVNYRGELLVLKGDLRGLRVSDFCIHHRLVKGRVEVSARGCVPQPVIPRCCEHMNEGKCVRNSNTEKPFNPYLTIPPVGDSQIFGVPFPWDNYQQYIEKPTCEPGYILNKFELDQHKAYLVIISETVLFTFLSDDGHRQHSPSPEYCVDVQENDGKYFAHSCKWNPEVYCKGKLCTRKCCPEGKALYLATTSCAPFKSPFMSPLSSSEIVEGWPKCQPMTHITNFTISNNGTLIHLDNMYQLSEFCIDNLFIGASVEMGGLACTKEIQETTWLLVRKTMFPMCLSLSCIALMLLILLHVWIPKLRENEGKYQLFHAASLFLAYSATLVAWAVVPTREAKGDACKALAFVMQFAFLSAFFWLNTMCFDVWRLFRNLVRSMYSTHSTVSMWKYLLYAIGGPTAITVVTIIIQYIAPVDGSVPGLVHPHIAEGSCWFNSAEALLAYFYGPIGVLFLLNFIFIWTTYTHLKIIRGDYKTENYPHEYTIDPKETTRKYDFFSAFWQRFYILVMMATCWATEILSFSIPPKELWAATEILNYLQGVFLVFIFLAHHKKRALIKEKLPKLFKFCNIGINHARTVLTYIRHLNKQLPKKISSSTILSNVSSLSSFSTSTSSFNINTNDPSPNTSPTGIISLSLKRKNPK